MNKWRRNAIEAHEIFIYVYINSAQKAELIGASNTSIWKMKYEREYFIDVYKFVESRNVRKQSDLYNWQK